MSDKTLFIITAAAIVFATLFIAVIHNAEHSTITVTVPKCVTIKSTGDLNETQKVCIKP
jgi:hypothetical protein